MSYELIFTEDAEADLADIYHYIKTNDSMESANYVLDNIELVLESLGEQPNRDSYPNELSAFGIKEFRALFFKPYRPIYSVVESQVVVYCVLDGRRDMRAVLEKRLLS